MKFTKVLRRRSLGGGCEDMHGEVTLYGTIYPVVVQLYLNDYPHGWRPVFAEIFAISP